MLNEVVLAVKGVMPFDCEREALTRGQVSGLVPQDRTVLRPGWERILYVYGTHSRRKCEVIKSKLMGYLATELMSLMCIPYNSF